MHSTDRQEFERQLSILCAGYNIHPSAERLDAYWLGLAKMELGTFARLVAHCLSEEGPEKLPTVRSLWPLSRHLRARKAAHVQPAAAWRGDPWLAAGNRHLYAFIVRRMMVGRVFNPQETAYLVEAKNAWVEDMRVEPLDGPGQKAAWDGIMDMALERMSAAVAA